MLRKDKGLQPPNTVATCRFQARCQTHLESSGSQARGHQPAARARAGAEEVSVLGRLESVRAAAVRSPCFSFLVVLGITFRAPCIFIELSAAKLSSVPFLNHQHPGLGTWLTFPALPTYVVGGPPQTAWLHPRACHLPGQGGMEPFQRCGTSCLHCTRQTS